MMKVIKAFIPLTLLVSCTLNLLNAQTKIGNNPTSINSGSLLELESTNKGFLMPRISITNTGSWVPLQGSSVTGMIVFNTNSSIAAVNSSYPILPGGIGFYYWDGGGWAAIVPGSASARLFWSLTGNAGTSSSTNFLGTTDNADLVFKANNTEGMRIAASNGYTGVGLTAANLGAPAYHLDVAHDLRIVSDRINYSSARLLFEGGQVDNGIQGNGIYMLDGQANGSRRQWFIGKPYGNYGSTGGSNSYLIKSELTDNMDITLPMPGNSTSSTIHFYIDALNNRVGIGTTYPSQRLHVGGQAVIDTLASGAATDSLVTVSKGSNAGGLLRSVSANNLMWLIKGNSATTPGTNALGAATDGNFIGTTDAQNLVIGTKSVKRMIIDQNGNAYGGNNGTLSTTNANNFTWGLNNTIGANNPRLSYAFGYNNILNNSTPYVFVAGAGHDIEGISSGAGALGFGAKIYSSTYAYSFGTAGAFTSGTANGYSIYNSPNSFLLGNGNKIYGLGSGYNMVFGQNNTVNGYDNCIILGGASVNASNNGNMILSTLSATNTISGGKGNDLTAAFTGGFRFFTGTDGSVINTANNTAGQVMMMPGPAGTTSTAAPYTAMMGVGVDTSLSANTAGYTGKLNSTLQVGGSFSAPIRTVSTSTTVSNTDFTIICTGTAALTVTLPAVGQCAGRIYNVINYGTSSTVTVKDAGGGNVMKSSATAAATVVFNSPVRTAFQSDGTYWYQLQ